MTISLSWLRSSDEHLPCPARDPIAVSQVVFGCGTTIEIFDVGIVILVSAVGWKGEQHAIELKLRRDTETEEEGLLQLAGYLDTAGLTEGWLILFDLRSTAPWSERIFQRQVEVEGRRIHIIGC